MKQLRKLLQLAPHHRLLLIQAALVLTLIRLGLWLLPFQVLCRLLAKFSVSSHASSHASGHASVSSIAVEQVVWAVEVVSRYAFGGVKCLARALTVRVLLAQQSDVTQLRIGVLKNVEGKLEAHAWVEHQGRVVIGGLQNLSDFTTLPALDGL